MLLLIVVVESVEAIAPPNEIAEFPVKALFSIVSSAELTLIAPPRAKLSPVVLPFDRVIEDNVKSPPLVTLTIRELLSPLMLKISFPGPLMLIIDVTVGN